MLKPITAIGLAAALSACSVQSSKQPPKYDSISPTVNRSQTYDARESEGLLANNQKSNNQDPAKFLIGRHGAVLDSVSTTVALSSGFVEMNPVVTALCGTDPIMVGICGFGGKLLIEEGANRMLAKKENYHPDMARRATNSVGFLGGCNNVALLAGAAFPASLAVGVVCSLTYLGVTSKKKKKDLEPTVLQGTVFENS